MSHPKPSDLNGLSRAVRDQAATATGAAGGGTRRRYYLFNNEMVVSEDDVTPSPAGDGASESGATRVRARQGRRGRRGPEFQDAAGEGGAATQLASSAAGKAASAISVSSAGAKEAEEEEEEEEEGEEEEEENLFRGNAVNEETPSATALPRCGRLNPPCYVLDCRVALPLSERAKRWPPRPPLRGAGNAHGDGGGDGCVDGRLHRVAGGTFLPRAAHRAEACCSSQRSSDSS